jgi:hypothetical protein
MLQKNTFSFDFTSYTEEENINFVSLKNPDIAELFPEYKIPDWRSESWTLPANKLEIIPTAKETLLLSEKSLAENWLTEEEDKAWENL